MVQSLFLTPARLICAALLVATTALAQVDGASTQAATVPTFDASVIKVHQYTPQHVNASQLFQVLQRSYGRNYRIAGRAPHEQSFNVHPFGDTILVIDEPEYANKLIDVMKQLDVPKSSDALAPEVRRTFSVDHISVHSALQAVQVLGRTNVAVVPESGQLIVRDTAERVAEVEGLLAEIDRAAPRILLQCMIVRAQNDEPSPAAAVPTELTDDLRKLVGFPHFEMATQGMLTAVAEPGRKLQLQLPSDTDESILELEVGAFESATRSLSLSRCEIFMARQKIETSVVIRPDEYLVLCATGRSPVFCVLRLTFID